MRYPALFCVVFFLLAACNNDGPAIRTLVPSLGVAPESLDFGEVGLPLSSSEPLFVSNTGGADLEVQLTFTGFPGVFTIDSPSELTLRPGDELELDVTFTPDTFRDYALDLRLDTNDEESPRVDIPITGTGADLPLPDIAVYPGLTVETDATVGKSPGLLIFDLVNEGGSDLVINAVRLEGPATFALESDPPGARIAARGTTTVLASYTPTEEGGELADLFIASNDPDEPEVQVRLIGNGGGPDFERPVAVIDCPGDQELGGPEYIRISGEQSFDPDGLEPLTYAWQVLSRPETSDAGAVLDPDDTPRVDLLVDAVGTWEVQLVVSNSLETESEPVVCAFEVEPADDLRVELSWNGPSSDVDLHVLRGGADLFDTRDDCHFCNPNPSWGASGTGDDPRLDIDDRSGFGPENVNIDLPEAITYDVKVHYFAPRSDGEVTATVKIWLDGTLSYTGLRLLEEKDDVWAVGTIDYGSGIFVPDPSDNVEATVATCQ